MPSQTFFNLPDKKREKILKAALEEFGLKTFTQSSIANIIKSSSIPRGSFYQYFEDKLDLYKYLLEKIKDEKLQYFQEIFEKSPQLGFFETYKQLVQKGLLFANDFPEYEKMGKMLFLEKDEKVKKAIFGEYSVEGDQLITYLLTNGIKKGEISSDIDVEFVSHILYTMQVTVMDYYMNKNPDFEVALEKLDVMMGIIKNGLCIEREVECHD